MRRLVIDRVSAASVETFTSQLAGLPRDSGQLIDIVLNLDRGTAGTFDDQINVPDGYRLVITGDTSWGYHTNTISGNWTVASGAVLVQGVTLVNSSDVPTILVQGGSLTLRDCTIEETSGGQRAAVEIVGGTADLGIRRCSSNILIIRGGELFTTAARPQCLPETSGTGTPFYYCRQLIERRVFDAIDFLTAAWCDTPTPAASIPRLRRTSPSALICGCWPRQRAPVTRR